MHFIKYTCNRLLFKETSALVCILFMARIYSQQHYVKVRCNLFPFTDLKQKEIKNKFHEQMLSQLKSGGYNI